ncbi:MAG: response regulator [Geopsychrobacter sp.]|nr:response regulator [Geopsychrobacter sp.]
MSPGHPGAHLNCPKCHRYFSIIAPTSKGEPPTIKPGPKVLIVDDARFFREMLVDLLQPLNLNLFLAETAASALEQLQTENPDLVMLDLNLPDQNGLEVIARIRADDRFKAIKILAMSGVYRREDDAMDAIRTGADAFINKSFRPDDLRNKIEKLLD